MKIPLPASSTLLLLLTHTHLSRSRCCCRANADLVWNPKELAEYAKTFPGVERLVTFQDIAGENQVSSIGANDEQLFATDSVTWVGQPLGVVLARSHDDATRAANALQAHVKYANVRTPLVATKDAVAANSFFPLVHKLETGDVEQAFATSEHVVSGEIEIGGQEHFYLEPNVTIATPSEDGEIEIVTSTQNPTKTQYVVSNVLGTPATRTVVRTKRIGGGFGGKETRSIFISAAAAVAAQVTGKPVRMVLDRNVDMLITGGRHPFLGKYKVGFTKEGRLQAADIQLFANGGCSIDLSIGVLDRYV